MSLTKITNRVIEPGAINANSIAEGVTLGGGGVTIDQIIVTDSNFANTEDTEIPATGGFLKLLGSGFEANANVFFSSTLSFSTEVTANTVSSSEVRLTVGATTHSIPFNLFLINRAGGTATKLSAFTSFVLQAAAGWWGGGIGPGSSSAVERIIFASDTGTASVRGPLSSVTYQHAAAGNADFGWFGGGYRRIPSTVLSCRVDRIDFAADTDTASIRGPLSLARNTLAATSNNNYGWFGGGGPGPVSTVDRIDFAADTGTASVRGPLSVARNRLAATGNDNYGWFSSYGVNRITFADDTGTASVRGNLSAGRQYLAATGNDNFGWFGGGFPGPVSTVDRIDFAADTGTASVRGPLSLARYSLAATGNDNYGWFGGGNPGPKSTVDRIDFADDTATASVRGPLSLARYVLAAVSGPA